MVYPSADSKDGVGDEGADRLLLTPDARRLVTSPDADLIDAEDDPMPYGK